MNTNQDNVVKIGTALKWRGVFDSTKKYYQENIVTEGGCVFRCKILSAIGKPPVKITDELGHITYQNPDVWDVLVDMAYYYNYLVDNRKLTKELQEYCKKLNDLIEKLQEDNKVQWDHIKILEKFAEETKIQLDPLVDTFCCFSEGIWIDTLSWNNDLLWDNNKYAITDDLQRQIDALSNRHDDEMKKAIEKHIQDVRELVQHHDKDLEEINTHLDTFEKNQNAINDYVLDQLEGISDTLSCFSTGIWENDLKWGNSALWDNNKFAITEDLQNQIDELKQKDEEHDKLLDKNQKEHDRFNERLDEHDALLAEHDQQIFDLVEGLTCFGFGQWFNELKWSNSAIWQNSNETLETFEDIYQLIEKNRNLSVEEHKNLSETDNILKGRADKAEQRITDLENENKEQQREIDSLLHRISVVSNGMWDNEMLWVNDSDWYNDAEAGMPCHCPADLEERVDNLDEGLSNANNAIEQNRENIEANQEKIAENAQNISDLAKDFSDVKKDYDDFKSESIAKDKDFAYQFRQNTRDHSAINDSINKIGTHFGCFVDGRWGDLFLWDNDHLWANEPGVVTSAIDDLHKEVETLHNADEEIGKELESIHLDIKKTNESISETNENLSKTDKELEKTNQEIESFKNEQKELHKDINYQFRQNAREHEAINDNIEKIGTHFGFIAEGKWGDLFLWDNDDLWANNPGLTLEILNEVQEVLENHESRINDLEAGQKVHSDEISDIKKDIKAIQKEQEVQNDELSQIEQHFGCFEDGVWCDLFYWCNDQLWSNSAEEANVHVELANQDQRLSAMENLMLMVMNQLNEQKEIIAKQQAQLDEITSCITVTNIGKWSNALLWDNETSWLNSRIEDYLCGCNGMGFSGLVSYDPPSQSVIANSMGAEISYNEPTKTLGINDAKVGFDYNEKDQSISIK